MKRRPILRWPRVLLLIAMASVAVAPLLTVGCTSAPRASTKTLSAPDKSRRQYPDWYSQDKFLNMALAQARSSGVRVDARWQPELWPYEWKSEPVIFVLFKAQSAPPYYLVIVSREGRVVEAGAVHVTY